MKYSVSFLSRSAICHSLQERDSAQLSWEQREAELEQQLEGLRRQPSADPHTAADSASRRLPGSVESGGNTTELKAQVRKAGDQVDRLSRALNKAQNELLKREGELATTKLQLASLESRQHQVCGGEGGEGSVCVCVCVCIS